jgi:hypothetical protein
MIPAAIGESRRKGELVLITVTNEGSRSSCSRLMPPRAIRAISIPSRMRFQPKE